MISDLLPRLTIAAALLCAGCGGENRSDVSERDAGSSPAQIDFRNPESCRDCHEAEYRSWLASHHANANRRVDSDVDALAYSVGETSDEAGRRYRIELEEGRPRIAEWVSDDEVDEAMVAMVIGIDPLQQAVVEGPRGRWQAHAMAWDPERSEWFNVFGSEERLPGEWGHWSGQGMTWNSNCASCHMTEYRKNYDAATDTYSSSWYAQGIGCVSCHGGMQEHLTQALAGDSITASAPDSKVSMDNCASCHSRREELTDGGFSIGESYDDHYRLTLLDHPTAYFPDGKALEEDFVYGSFMHSKMGHAGVSCFDCHEPHSNGLVAPLENNALCIQCHSTGRLDATIIESPSHSGHALGSEGNSCVECHMPERVYMARDPRRDHGFTVPDPYMSEVHGAPNACVSCHEDQDTDWVAARFEELFGDRPRVRQGREKADMLASAWSGELEGPDPILDQLSNERNPYWQASLLRLLRPFASEQRVRDAARQALEADAAVARDAAVFALSSLPDAATLVGDVASDPSRAPRLQAAAVLVDTPLSEPALEAEYEAYLMANADRPFGALRIAERAALAGDATRARHFAELAVSFDRRNPDLRYDAAILLDRVGLAELGIRHLRVAHGYDPDSGRYLYAIGLLQAELGRLEEGVASMVAALRREPEQDRWWFNLSNAQTRLGDLESARASLEAALELDPENESYRQQYLRIGGE